MIIIPPDTRRPVLVDARRIGEAALRRVVQDAGHESPGVVDDGSNLHYHR